MQAKTCDSKNVSTKIWNNLFLFNKTSIQGKRIMGKGNLKTEEALKSVSEFIYGLDGVDCARESDCFKLNEVELCKRNAIEKRRSEIKGWLDEFGGTSSKSFDDWFGAFIEKGELMENQRWQELAFEYLD
jgi:hypothetical protein